MKLDPAVFDDPDFKEDSVREEVVAPLLRRLGYGPTGAARIVRSKALRHPFIRVGTREHPVTTVPDYTLFQDERAVLVLDAKSPSEDILDGKHVQQAYSYAIHPEIRCEHFALCNGRRLAVFDIRNAQPLLVVSFNDFEARWDTIEKHLAPRFLLEPHLRQFRPDFGTMIARLGLSTEADLIFPGARLGLFARVSDELYAAGVDCNFGSGPYCASFEFHALLLDSILAGLPTDLREAFRRALSRSPFQAEADLMLECDLVTRLGPVIEVQHESFRPLVVIHVLGSRFVPEQVPGRPDDVPSYVFRLSDAYSEARGPQQ